MCDLAMSKPTLDSKRFITSHQFASASENGTEVGKLALRFQDGIPSNRYKPVNYDHLRFLAHQKRQEGAKTLLKVKRLEQTTKQSRETNLLKQHQKVWQKEFLKLNNLRRRTQAEVDMVIRLAPVEFRYLYENYQDTEALLARQFVQFKKDTVDPIWTLKEDLQYWIMQNRVNNGKNKQQTEEDLGDPTTILETVESVKIQQNSIMEKLESERIALEMDLKSDCLLELCATHMKSVSQGIPEEAFNLQCPDDSFKVAILEEFLEIDAKYREKVEALDNSRAHIFQQSLDGWSEEGHLLFISVMEQYPYDLPNRRMLYVDRLQREFPVLTRKQLVSHEDWCIAEKHYHKRHKSLISDWLRDRKELLVKATVTFHELQVAWELQTAVDTNHEKQKDLCTVLYDKVVDWRQRKMEALKLEQEIMEANLKKETEERQIQEEQNRKKRDQVKKKIAAKHESMEHERKVKEEQNQIRLDALKKVLEEQAAIDKERVHFREAELVRKQDAQKAEMEERQKEEMLKEERLEALRETVRVHVPADANRVLLDTKSWTNRRHAEKPILMNQPLFDINTFTSKQITTDPRVKLERKLREAGLHQTDYARHVMSKAQPLHPPRRDTEATHKFD